MGDWTIRGKHFWNQEEYSEAELGRLALLQRAERMKFRETGFVGS